MRHPDRPSAPRRGRTRLRGLGGARLAALSARLAILGFLTLGPPASEATAAPSAELQRPAPSPRAGLPSGRQRSQRWAAAPSIHRCVAAYRAKRYSAALACFRARLRQTGPDAQEVPLLLYAAGYAAYQLRRYAEATRLLARAAQAQPRDGDTQFMLGLAHLRQRHYRRARHHLRRALALGLRTESPAEAQRLLRSLRALLAAAPRPGWILGLTFALGYDSRPMLSGIAGNSGTSDGSGAAGSPLADLALKVGYRWVHRQGQTRVHYAFREHLVLSDLYGSPPSAPSHGHAAPGAQTRLSTQSHVLQAGTRWQWGRYALGSTLAAQLDLVGLRPMRAQAVGGTLAAEAAARWHPLTETALGLAYLPQAALDEAVAYLSGHGLGVWLAQRFRPGSRFRLEGRYRYAHFWLGTATETCDGATACAASVPYAHHSHRVTLSLRARLAAWLTLHASASLWHRRYDAPGQYAPTGAGPALVTVRRVDTAGDYAAALIFRVRPWCHIGIRYGFTHNHSSVTEATTGFEEGYQRHLALLWLHLKRLHRAP